MTEQHGSFNRRGFLAASGGTTVAALSGAQAAAAASPTGAATSAARVDRLTVEHAAHLLGTDVTRPRLSWVVQSPANGARQTGYQVRVARSLAALRDGRDLAWDSGKVGSAQTVLVSYGGPELTPGTRYHWQVRVWDEHGAVSPWSSPDWWETTLAAWRASWIGAGHPVGAEVPAPLLRREFGVPGDVASARLYVSGLAYHRVEINGQRVGDAVLDPGFTDYDETVLYAVHDVTAMLHSGRNAIGAELGRGFYAMTTENVWDWHRPSWRDEPKLIAQLEITGTDGRRHTVVTDPQWRVTEGPTVSNSLYAGESYDARRAPAGWSTPGFDDSGWRAATRATQPKGTLRAQRHEPITVVGTVRPQQITRVGDSYVVDFGRTMAGWTRITVDEPAGTTVRLSHGEKLRPDKRVLAQNTFVAGERQQTDTYTSAGGGPATWQPSFSYKGFRYVQVDGVSAAPTADTVTAMLLRSDVPEISSFSCSEPMFEQLDRTMRRTLANNLYGIPTDTPLYEKNGWTGDAQLGASTMAYSFGMARFFTKWLADIADAQDEKGQPPVIVPSGSWGYTDLAPSPEWTTVFPYLLRQMHRWYGDTGLLRERFAGVRRYLDFEIGRLERGGLANTQLGDYLSPGYSGGNPPEDTRLTATAYLYRALLLAAETADLVDDDATAGRYRGVAERCRTALNKSFLDTRRGHYRTATDPEYRQSSNAIPLAFGIVPPSYVDSVVASLVTDIRNRGNHMNTGSLGTSVLLPVLTAHGHAELAHTIATNTTYPSWGWWLANGADTMWERWDTEARSRDHYFQGTVTDWLYANVAGLRTPEDGYARVVIRPDARTGVSWARTEIDTVRGRLAVGWTAHGDGVVLTASLPVGCTGEVHVPARQRSDVDAPDGARFVRAARGFAVYSVGAGQWRFRSRTAG